MLQMLERADEPLRVGLVLGAGGPVGHAYHAGVLRALADTSGWEGRQADLVVGTSAGAQIGALLRAGVRGADLAARVCGEQLSKEGAAIVQHYTRPGHGRRAEDRRTLRPSAPGYLARVARQPWRTRLGPLVAALMPEGYRCLQTQADGLRKLFGGRWPHRPLWITAVDLDDGRITPFGRRDAPSIDLGTAVTCSGAVPGICRPVHAGGRRYVDGGIISATHIDLLGDGSPGHELPDIVLVSSPLSRMIPMRAQLRVELRRLSRKGIPAFVFEPGPFVTRLMGWNVMDLARSADVTRAAYLRTVTQLRTPIGAGLTRLLRRQQELRQAEASRAEPLVALA